MFVIIIRNTWLYLAHAREGILYYWQKKGLTGTAFVKNGNERCAHTEYCDIKPGPVLGQAVSRPSMEHTIFVFIIIDQQTVWTAVRSAHYPVIL